MSIYLIIARRATCEICRVEWYLEPGEMPERCFNCNSADWEWGKGSRAALAIRQGRTRKRKVLNPGATSLARQQHGKKQWRRFRTKEEDDAANAKKALDEADK